MSSRIKHIILFIAIFAYAGISYAPLAFAQNNVVEQAQPQPTATAKPRTNSPNNRANTNKDRNFKASMQAVNETSGIAKDTIIHLWGIEKVETIDAKLQLQGRVALDNTIGKNPADCVLKKRIADKEIVAQCINAAGVDLGLYMLQNGYAIVDRAAIYNTVFEAPYLQAEMDSQNSKVGVWQENDQGGYAADTNIALILSFILFIIMIGAFCTIAYYIMRGFKEVIKAQNENLNLSNKERDLKNKEREIFANMLDSEIKANKSKIEAYLIVYDEMLKSLNAPDKQPKYQVAGDIVQQQPALSRVVFDRNTDKLDVLGRELSSEVIHFYARIKTNAKYINLEPEMPLEEALSIVEGVIDNAQRLNNISDQIIDTFAENGLSSGAI